MPAACCCRLRTAISANGSAAVARASPTRFGRQEKKKFLLIGATGRIGEAIVEQGLAQGHDITAVVHRASKVAASHPLLHLVVGDVLNPQDVDAAMVGQDAVICSLGTGVTFRHVTLS